MFKCGDTVFSGLEQDALLSQGFSLPLPSLIILIFFTALLADHPNKEEFLNRLFISYSTKDFGWVTDNLISVLEKHSIAYSIHSRDFEVGRPIVQNMADNVYCSRQVLIVLSESYLASNFCREELHMAVQRGVETGDSSLILVMINNLRKEKLPAALRKKRLLDFDKHVKKNNWEEKILLELLKGGEDSVRMNHTD